VRGKACEESPREKGDTHTHPDSARLPARPRPASQEVRVVKWQAGRCPVCGR
jgi:hypothetical protein